VLRFPASERKLPILALPARAGARPSPLGQTGGQCAV
jgi:hypothetical protein